MVLSDLLKKAREIWGEKRMGPLSVGVAMGVVYGDICRAIRDDNRGEQKKELGNMILSTVRWADDLGFDLYDCLAAAERSQRQFVQTSAWPCGKIVQMGDHLEYCKLTRGHTGICKVLNGD